MQAQLQASEHWPPALLRQRQFEQLAALLAHADAEVPLQRKRLRAAGYHGAGTDIEALWPELPVLTRAEVQVAGEEAFAAALPMGHGRIAGGATSGSTGIPLRMRKIELSQFMTEAQSLRHQSWHDLDFTATLAGVQYDPAHKSSYPAGFSSRSWGGHAGTAFATGPAHRLDVPTPVAAQVNWIGRTRPAYLVSFPSNLGGLARYCRNHGLAWPWLRAVFTRGEVVDPALRTLCETAWNVPMVDCYSAEEAGVLALQCPVSAQYHVAAENVLLEVLDANDRACNRGEIGRVVITPLHNFAMPLIRYAIGDYAEVGIPCGCGRTLGTLARILGRSRARLLLPSGERRFPYNPVGTFARYADILEYQIVQRSPVLVELLLVVRRPLGVAAEAALAAALTAAFGHAFPLRFTYVESIPRGTDGKLHDIQCEVPEAD
jgi:phenylacetate-CoA ligase